MEHAEIIVIGSGIGGLCCAALLAHYGYDVLVCESHSIPGGAAHGFERGGFSFDSGPSLYSGLSYSPSPNPLRQVLDAIEENCNWINYDTWGCCLPEGDFATTVGADQFCEILQNLRGADAVQEWRELQQIMQPLGAAAIALPPAAMRFDYKALQTVRHFLPSLLRQTPQVGKLIGPFSRIMNRVVQDDFARNWLDMLCFLLSGLPADGTIAAEVAFMFADWYRPGVQLDYPQGGSASLVAALVRGLKKYGGELKLNVHIEKILLDGDQVRGVRLRDGEEIIATKAVISNASIWDTLKLLPKSPKKLQHFINKRQTTPECDSFMHLHLGIDATGLDNLACHYIVVNDWSCGIDAPQNLVLISIPSVLDPTLAPAGKHTIHVYTPGNEPYALWAELDRRSPEYIKLKQQRAEIMWQALKRIIPDIRLRCDITLVGTPVTHSRFLRRHHGSYGPAIRAGKGVFPGPRTPIKNLWCCGDSIFPGIGLPAVAASGMVLANTLAPVNKHQAMLQKIGILNI
ncbi:MAG: NAD(P)/FAD-dependent oxidoreductase [Leptolyngbya sp. SIO3F4]|nr:NAD(P)/FAD-dependent oxidoreductase [Leptolyngbya sp. SIO3F4]